VHQVGNQTRLLGNLFYFFRNTLHGISFTKNGNLYSKQDATHLYTDSGQSVHTQTLALLRSILVASTYLLSCLPARSSLHVSVKFLSW